MNVVKDKIFTGRILDMVEKTLTFVRDQIKEHTYLGTEGKFVTTPEFPEFVWKEIIINAATHRDYSIKGTDIQVKMFDDRIVVESPGNLPGIVRLNNMRQVHFSRNPKIAAFLHEYDYVQEFGEGVDRMYKEMEKAGLPAPEYKDVAFMLHATIRNGIGAAFGASGTAFGASGATPNTNVAPNTSQTELTEKELLVYRFIKANPEASTRIIADNIRFSTRTVQRCISALLKKGMIENEGTRQRVKWGFPEQR